MRPSLDTGAKRTVVSTMFMAKIPEGQRLKLEIDSVKRTIKMACGSTKKYKHVATFSLQFGNLKLSLLLIVADISDEVLLGGDLLQIDHGGPFDMMLRDVEVPRMMTYLLYVSPLIATTHFHLAMSLLTRPRLTLDLKSLSLWRCHI